jgi:hypothetical protein
MDKFPDDLGDMQTTAQLRKRITDIIVSEKKKHPEGGYAEFTLPDDDRGTLVMRELEKIFRTFEYKDQDGTWKPVWIVVPKSATGFRVLFQKQTTN